jgi:hypothetical protein
VDGMSPMDEFAWFQSPKVSYVQTVSGQRVQLCGIEAHRVGLLIANASPVGCVIAPDPQIPTSADRGIPLYGYSVYLSLAQHDYGNLVQWEWWAAFVGGPAPVLLVTEVLLRDWPCPDTGATAGPLLAPAPQPQAVPMHVVGAVGPGAGLTGLSGLTGLTPSAAAPPLHLLYDQFIDANGTALSAHTMDIGPGWTIDSGTWTIQSNTAQNSDSDGAGGAYRIFHADSTGSDVNALLHFIAPANQFATGIICRMQDVNNHWHLVADSLGGSNTFRIEEISGGSRVSKVNDNPVLVSGHTYDMEFNLKGTALRGKIWEYVAGVPTLRSTINFTSSDFQTKTICGLDEYRNTTGGQYVNPNSFDTFTVDSA